MVHKYVAFFGTCVAIALVLVFSFAPWAGNLSIQDVSPLRATLAIMIPVICVVVFGGVVYWCFAPRKRVFIDVSNGVDEVELRSALGKLSDEPLVSSFARSAEEQLRRVKHAAEKVRTSVKTVFEEGSMTSDRYSAGIDNTVDVVMRTLAALATRADALDADEYKRAKMRGLSTLTDAYDSELSELDNMLESNERLIAELLRLDVEICSLESGNATTESENVLDEMHELVEQASYYA